ncbi:hypothetical protein PAPHI01_0591 [Pancytospora philotis]|nr:hypothetical protein PAPHI01_0591 [Pancytospora philotis]
MITDPMVEGSTKKFESKLDLDYDSFLTKKIDKCVACGDIYYAGARPPHACARQQGAQGHDATRRPTDSAHSTIQRASYAGDARAKEPADGFCVRSAIYSIWKADGFRRHAAPAEDCPSSSEEQCKDKFSFSPYDNFF